VGPHHQDHRALFAAGTDHRRRHLPQVADLEDVRQAIDEILQRFPGVGDAGQVVPSHLALSFDYRMTLDQFKVGLGISSHIDPK